MLVLLAMIVALTVAFGAEETASAQCQYSVEEIVAPPCPFSGPPPLIGLGLNNHGEVVGWFFDCEIGGLDHAFYWSEKTGFIELPKPDGATTMRANDINDHGQIVGEVIFPSVAWKGFMYDMNTETFHFLESKFGVGTASANAINNNGVVAGSRSISKTGSTPFNAVIWDTNTGEVIDLGVMNGPNSNGRDINDLNQVIGWTGQSITANNVLGFWFNSKRVTVLEPIPGGDTSVCLAVGPGGLVLGQGHISGEFGTNIHAFLWRDQWLDILAPPPGFQNIGGGDLNAVGQRVLTATAPSSPNQPFLWQHDNLVNLNMLTPAKDGMSSAMAINDNGQILLRLGNTRAILITPVDVPFADLNYDCKVDLHDLMILLNQWGTVENGTFTGRGVQGTPSADLNGDGVVDVIDLFILLGNWSP